MAKESKPKWAFKPKFRAGLYSWNGTAKATKNLRAAVSEIRKAYKKNPLDAVDATIYLMERFWPALEHIDSSSGALGRAVNDAIEKLMPLVIEAPADEQLRRKWTDRLFDAICDDGVEYLSPVTGQWGRLCVTDSLRNHWFEELLPRTEKALRSRREDHYYFVGTSACLSCLLESERFEELRRLLDLADPPFWHYEVYWAEALLRQGHVDEAIQHARSLLPETSHDEPRLYWYGSTEAEIDDFCERVLYEAGRRREAYEQYSLQAISSSTYLAHFQSLTRRYPEYEPRQILMDLLDKSGHPMKSWFSSARKCEMYDIALQCAESGTVDPRTLTTAARDTLQSHPSFAWRVSLLGIKYLLLDYASFDELDAILAVRYLVDGARNAGDLEDALAALAQVLDMRKKAQKVPRIVHAELKRLGVSLPAAS